MAGRSACVSRRHLCPFRRSRDSIKSRQRAGRSRSLFMSRHPLTPAGFRKLSDELKNLKEVVRGKIVRDIGDARAHGDISENSEYEDAKERQSHCEGRIVFLEGVCAG